MAPQKGSAYGKGFSLNRQAAMNSVKLPQKIRCNTCKKLQTADLAFSNKKLLEFKNGLATGRITPATQEEPIWISCRHCTGTQRNEMQCCICRKIKGLDGFSKAQRRTPDEARCLSCIIETDRKYVIEGTANNRLSDDEKSHTSSSTEGDEESDGDTWLQDDNASSGGALVDFSAPTALTTRSLNKLNLQQSEQQSRSKNTMSSKWTSYAESGVEARNEEKRKRPGKAFAAYEIDEADDEGEEEKEDEDEDEEDATASQANSKGSWANSKISSEYRDMDPNARFAKLYRKAKKGHRPEYHGAKEAISDEEDSDEEYLSM